MHANSTSFHAPLGPGIPYAAHQRAPAAVTHHPFERLGGGPRVDRPPGKTRKLTPTQRASRIEGEKHQGKPLVPARSDSARPIAADLWSAFVPGSSLVNLHGLNLNDGLGRATLDDRAVQPMDRQVCTADSCSIPPKSQPGTVTHLTTVAQERGFGVQMSDELNKRIQRGNFGLEDVIVVFADQNHGNDALHQRVYDVMQSGKRGDKSDGTAADLFLVEEPSEGGAECLRFFGENAESVREQFPQQNCINIDTGRSRELDKEAARLEGATKRFLQQLKDKGALQIDHVPTDMNKQYNLINERWDHLNRAAAGNPKWRKEFDELGVLWREMGASVKANAPHRDAAIRSNVLKLSKDNPGKAVYVKIGELHTRVLYPALLKARKAVLYLVPADGAGQ